MPVADLILQVWRTWMLFVSPAGHSRSCPRPRVAIDMMAIQIVRRTSDADPIDVSDRSGDETSSANRSLSARRSTSQQSRPYSPGSDIQIRRDAIAPTAADGKPG